MYGSSVVFFFSLHFLFSCLSNSLTLVQVSVATALAMDRILRPPNPGAKPRFMSLYDPGKPTKEPVKDDADGLFDLTPIKKTSSRALMIET